jgi:hypothetical protein
MVRLPFQNTRDPDVITYSNLSCYYSGALLPSTDPDDPEVSELDFADLDCMIPIVPIDLSAGIKGAEGSRAALWDWGFDISKGGVLDKRGRPLPKKGTV